MGYWDKTPREIYYEVKGRMKRIEDDHRKELEQTRFIMWASLVPHRGKGQTLKLEDVLKLPGEKEKVVPKLTTDEKKRVKQMADLSKNPLFGKKKQDG